MIRRYGPIFLLSIFLACLYITAEVCRSRVIERSGSKGVASWYVPSENSTDLVCAFRSRDFGKFYRVCGLENNKCVVVRHTSWGPDWFSSQQGRIIDLSRAAFAQIADPRSGVARVIVKEEKPTQE